MSDFSSRPSHRPDNVCFLPSELPVIQAPMAGAQGSELAIAVCEAGGLGSLPCAMLTASQLEQELERITAATDQPFNVNFFCHTPPEVDYQVSAQWLDYMSRFYQEHDIDPESVKAGAGRVPFSHEAADILERYKPAVVSFHFGLPEEALLARVKSWGSLVISSATTVQEAIWLQDKGADAVIAQGLEAGGHRGMFLSDELSEQQGTFTLVRQICQATDLPVIAAGGIADAKGVQAAMALGAEAVQVGTAYLLCPEARISEIHRQALQSPQAHHTALTNLFSGRPARGIVNRFMSEAGPLNGQVPEFPLATAFVAPLRQSAEAQGLGDFSPLWAGQNVSGCQPVPAGELTRKLAGAVL